MCTFGARLFGEQPTESFVNDDIPGGGVNAVLRRNQLVAESLVRPFLMEVGAVFTPGSPERRSR